MTHTHSADVPHDQDAMFHVKRMYGTRETTSPVVAVQKPGQELTGGHEQRYRDPLGTESGSGQLLTSSWHSCGCTLETSRS